MAPLASSCWMRWAKFWDESMGAKRTKAMCAAMRKTAEVSAMAVVAARWRRRAGRIQAVAGPAAKAGLARPAGKTGHGKPGGQTQRGKAGAGEVEQAGHGEGVVADATMGEQVANVGQRGDV